jgi:hypothetical protein
MCLQNQNHGSIAARVSIVIGSQPLPSRSETTVLLEVRYQALLALLLGC